MSDHIRLAVMKGIEWVRELSPAGKVLLFAALFLLGMVGVHFGVIPSRRIGDTR